MRVVLDTTIFVRGLINPHSRCGRLLFLHADRYTLIVSKPTVQELLEVLQRPELTLKYRGLAKLNLRRVIDIIAGAEAVELGEIPPTVRDPKDDIFIATARAGQADYLVSEDKDLLDLGEFAGISILSSAEFIALFEPEGE